MKQTMQKHEKDLQSLALKLFEINAFKFGDFQMKVGINSPVYFDLRVIVSYPEVMETLSNLLVEFIKEENIECDHVCGVPYTALPIATLISVKNSKSMLIRRKEVKSYGTKKLIEGIYNVEDNCLIIEDVVTSGSSILETVASIRGEGIKVTDAIVVVDREQGGIANIEDQGVKMHTLFTLSYLMEVLKDAGKITDDTVRAVNKFIKGCQIQGDGSFTNQNEKFVNELSRTSLSFEKRATYAKCPLAKDLFNLMATKKTNLCLAADITKCDEILSVADKCGPYICVLKTHVDIIDDFNETFISDLVSIAKKHNFLIMEDRKFADIGNTVSLQFSKGQYKISQWADLITVHSIPGQGVLKGIKAALQNDSKKSAVFLLAEMSSHGNLINEQYKQATVKLATESSDVDIVAGLVCQSRECFAFPGLIQLTPGVKIDDVTDDLGQKYQTPEYIVKEKGADIAVVGRGILNSKSIEKTAILYRDRLWSAYTERIEGANQA